MSEPELPHWENGVLVETQPDFPTFGQAVIPIAAEVVVVAVFLVLFGKRVAR